MLSITDLPCDIHDNIAAFLPNKDLIEFVCASRQIENGHLTVVQFLHSVGAPYTFSAMNYAAKNGHLAVVQFLGHP